MDEDRLKALLQAVRAKTTSPGEALEILRDLPFEDLSFARVDHHRTLRQGIPEVVFAEGKSPVQASEIAGSLFRRAGRVLMTRCSDAHVAALREHLAGKAEAVFSFNAAARCLTVRGRRKVPRPKGRVLILTAGTSDMPVAEEARATLEFLGSAVDLASDVGVAGIHRLAGLKDRFRQARALIVVAGMEGALPSVVGGVTDRPVIAVPTSVGYGTSFAGLTALFAMLNSCVPGIGVVNVDNGFGAACLAHRINIRK